MNSKTYQNIELNALKLLYNHYKDFIIPFFVIIASILLFGRITLPSFMDLLAVLEERKLAVQRLNNVRNNISLLKSIDDSTLDLQLAIVARALPIEKDFSGVLYAISDASSKAGISVGDFKLDVGSLSKLEDTGKFLTYDLDLKLNGDIEATKDFIDRIRRTLPLSEVTKISVREGPSTIGIHFYYKPVAQLKRDDTLPLSPVSAKGLSLIEKLSTFSMPIPVSLPETPGPTLTPLPTSTSSADANPFF